jgi:hypothetical protein
MLPQSRPATFYPFASMPSLQHEGTTGSALPRRHAAAQLVRTTRRRPHPGGDAGRPRRLRRVGAPVPAGGAGGRAAGGGRGGGGGRGAGGVPAGVQGAPATGGAGALRRLAPRDHAAPGPPRPAEQRRTGGDRAFGARPAPPERRVGSGAAPAARGGAGAGAARGARGAGAAAGRVPHRAAAALLRGDAGPPHRGLPRAAAHHREVAAPPGTAEARGTAGSPAGGAGHRGRRDR